MHTTIIQNHIMVEKKLKNAVCINCARFCEVVEQAAYRSSSQNGVEKLA